MVSDNNVVQADKDKTVEDINVLYEDNTKDFTYKHDVNSIAGSNVTSLLTIGTRVVRGPDWKWGDQVNFIYIH